MAGGEEPGDRRQRGRGGRRAGAGRGAGGVGPRGARGAAGADPSLDHDDPVEEVFGDQVACADLIVLSKADLLDAAGAARAQARVGGIWGGR